MKFRLPFLILATALGVSCGTKPPAPGPLGPETCNNKADDNGDGKVDCLDPKCFGDTACRGMGERCDNDIDDNGDTLADCLDPLCAGQVCGFDCTCIGGVKVTGSTGGGSGGGANGGGTGGSSGGGTGGSGGGGTGGSSGGGTGGGTGGSSGGGTGGSSGGTGGSSGGGTGGSAGGGTGGSAGGGTGGSAGGGTGGSAGGGTGGSGGGGTGGSGGGTGGGVAATETNCADNLDNDNDNATDCDDTNCVGVTCGMGCVCALNRKTETNCNDGVSNDGDGQIDCADSDCVGAGTEICNDGVDNDCDRGIDCGDSSCSGSPQCTGLQDGKPCLADGQCAGQKCILEATSGAPNGSCTNLTACNPSTNAGCNGGLCRPGSPIATCYARCTGTGVSGSGACRAGYLCVDLDSNTGNNNNYCTAACSNSSECSGSGSGYGCNPWSKRCGNTDRGLGRYGAPCTANTQCESNLCITGPDYPGGYCFGICRGDTQNCATGGICSYNSASQDNFGICFENCVTSSNCRQSEHYNCWGPASDPFGTCRCLTPGEYSSNQCNLCCSGACSLSTCD